MIKITLLTGSHAGQERTPTLNEINPLDLIMDCVRKGYVWVIDWTQATLEESFQWGRADLVGRILRALMEGRPVSFAGVEYRATADSIQMVTGEVEDAITNSGCMVIVEDDNEHGVRIGVHGTEHRVQ